MAILTKWKKKDSRNSVQPPSAKSSTDQFPSSPLSHPSSGSSAADATAQHSPQTTQPATFNNQANARQSQIQGPPPASPQIPTNPAATAAAVAASQKSPNIQRKSSNGGFNSQIPVPQQHPPQHPQQQQQYQQQQQQQPQQHPPQAGLGFRSVSNGSSSSSVYTNGISSPPASANSKMSGQMLPPPQQQLQQLRYNGPNGLTSPTNPPSQQGQPMQQRRGAPPQQNPNMPQYPWSQKSISNASPFPRYGHAANYIAARDGEVFVMGGLKGSNVFGDLWVIETGKFPLTAFFGFVQIF